MAEIINLNRFRKQRARTERKETAAENREKFGRLKTAKDRERAERESREKALDGNRLEKGDD